MQQESTPPVFQAKVLPDIRDKDLARVTLRVEVAGGLH